MKFIIDMNLSPGWVSFLSAVGYQAVHWITIGPSDALDDEIMAFARENGFVVLTQDLDFGELLALNGELGPSVVQLRGGDPMPEVSGRDVARAIEKFGDHIEGGALVTVSLSGSRVRTLPILQGNP